MKVSILTGSLTATQTISFGFDQNYCEVEDRICFKMYSWSDLKRLSPTEMKNEMKDLYESDYIILSRWYPPFTVEKIIQGARKRRKAIYLHLDDFLYRVPKSIGLDKWKFYANPTILDSLDKTTRCVDGVIASTPNLAEKIRMLYPDIKIHTCPFYKCFSPDINQDWHQRAVRRPYPVIGYMGTQSHADDLDCISESVSTLLRSFTNLSFETFGVEVTPTLLQRFGDRCSTISKIDDYDRFLAKLKALGWWIGLAPLDNNEFNYCKANTKALEYLTAGIPVVASNIGPYKELPQLRIPDDSPSQLSNYLGAALCSFNMRDELFKSQIDYARKFQDPTLLLKFYKTLSTSFTKAA